MSTTPTTAVATFGAGCYWGTEKFFRNDFESAHPGSILDVKVGFMHPDASTPRPAPTYREVCGGDTGFVEVAQVTFNPAKASYRDLVKFFFTFHDPTTSNRQGNDVGTQYASAIFTHSSSSSSSDPASATGSETETQESVAKAVISELNAALQSSDPTKRPAFRHGRSFAGEFVTTAVIPAGPFYPAHEEHQLYLAKNPSGYCNHSIRFKW